MKRNIFALILCVCMLFSLLCGCSGDEAPAQVPGDMSVSDGAPKAPATEAPTEAPAPETSAPAAERGVLTKIGNVMDAPETIGLHALGENLLIEYERSEYDSTRQSFTHNLYLTLISPKDGAVLETKQAYLLDGIMHDHAIMREDGGEDYLVDSFLSPVELYNPPMPNRDQLRSYWHSPDFKVGYTLCYVDTRDNNDFWDLLRVDMETGDVTVLATDLEEARATYHGAQYVLLNYYASVGRPCTLDLYTGELEEAPMQAWLYDRIGDTWVMQDDYDINTYYIETSEGRKTIHFDKPLSSEADELTDLEEVMHFRVSENLYLLTEQHLFVTGEYGRSGTLYDVSGKMISHYEFPEPAEQNDMFYTVSAPVWSEADGGYYLLVSSGDSCDLYFWDISVPTEGESLGIG